MPLQELYETCKSLISLTDSNFTPRIMDFRNKREEVLSNPKNTENGNENEMECEKCKKNLTRKSLLKHISHHKECKEFYGSRFEDMKKEQIKRKKTKNSTKRILILQEKGLEKLIRQTLNLHLKELRRLIERIQHLIKKDLKMLI